jgi:NAD(P)-dependent dehydrogenase (short-subunit alcohol dehydrogenase family)
MRLPDKVAVITGAASGIGLASARRFAAEGARVAMGDVDAAGGERAEAEIHAAGGDAFFVPTDVSSAADVQALIEAAVARYGKLDVIFNNAGINMVGSPVERTEQDFDLVVAVNLKGVFLGCKYALPHLLKNPEGGVILNMASNGGLIGRPGDPLYVATKHGVMGLTKSLALLYADRRVRVNALCPGPIDTPLLWGGLESDDERESYARRVVAACPTPRMASPDEVAAAALFLVSDEASFVTGVGLPVDGGKSAGVFNSNRYRTDFELQDWTRSRS